MATVYIPIDAKSLEVGASAIPELVAISGTNYVEYGYAFDAASREDVYFKLVLPLYGSGNVSVIIDWYSRSGSTSGAVVWGARLGAITPGDSTSVEAKGYGTAATTTTTVNSNAKGLTSTTVAISSLDSLAALDRVIFNVYRDAASGSDTMSGDAIIDCIYLSYSDT